ncbi:hypothetical protein [Streptomyces sp. bgisy100]|uniref:hypothetical protein n=1 Tax=Streptomyces sp. bgisy100 TaxID=3413783 RepID=UPI003D70359B
MAEVVPRAQQFIDKAYGRSRRGELSLERDSWAECVGHRQSANAVLPIRLPSSATRPDGMRRVLPVLAIVTAVLLSGCGSDGTAPWQRDQPEAGPPTATVSPDRTDSVLAARYRKAGGDPGVQGIHYATGKEDEVVLTVWTRKKNGYESFDDFAAKLASFLDSEGVRLGQGYVLNVYGPDGKRLHNYDTTTLEKSS